ncbi:MAG: PIN domain-containing protein [Deferrisomatales bacterium]
MAPEADGKASHRGSACPPKGKGTKGWHLDQVRFYTGVPDAADNQFWSGFWQRKLAMMGRQGVWLFTRPLRYRNRVINLPGGGQHTFLSGEEKGIDVRIALDVVRLGHRNLFDVSLVFSQDQDLSEVAEEIRVMAQEQGRWIKMASAFPTSPTSRNRRGINKTDWLPIDRTTSNNDPWNLRSAIRNNNWPDNRNNSIGLRLGLPQLGEEAGGPRRTGRRPVLRPPGPAAKRSPALRGDSARGW